MFAKLKKKVLEEGGGGSDNERAFGPGLASPVKKDSPASPFNSRRRSIDSPARGAAAAAALNSGPAEDDKSGDGSREEVLTLLTKRTEQVKKMEAKISDLAAIIKDKNKAIDKLDTSLEKQQKLSAQKLQDMNEQYQASRAKMTDGFTLALQKKDEEMQQKIEAVEKSLKKAEQYKDKFFKREEENDELQGLTSQEMAKVKHMLLNTQEELKRCQAELAEKFVKQETADKQVLELQSEVHSLMEQITSLTTKSENVEEENVETTKQIQVIQSEKDALSTLVHDLHLQLSQKSSQLSTVQETQGNLSDEHLTLQRNTDLHRQKMNSLLEEKDEHISHLQERVTTLEQRLKDSDLSEDEHLKALQSERTSLEKKLEETRQQLSEVKATWSDKITHLENQISHLNTKIVEDAEELISAKQEADAVKKKFQKQMEALQSKLEETEKKAKLSEDLVSEKGRLLDKQKQTMEAELIKCRKGSSELEEELRDKVSSLEVQVTKLKQTRDHDKLISQQQITQLENSQEECLEKEIDGERQITKLEDEIHKYKIESSHREKENIKLTNQLKNKTKEMEHIQQKVSKLEEKLNISQSELDRLEKSLHNSKLEQQQCTTEKDDALLRNAELSQQYESYKRLVQEEKSELQREVGQRNSAISGLEQSLQDMQAELMSYQDRVKKLEAEKVVGQGEIVSTEVNRLKKELDTIEEQLSDKNKTIKVQQQRLTDLKKTLQRELKVQALPNDELGDTKDCNDSVTGLKASSTHPRLAVSPNMGRKELRNSHANSQASIVPSRYMDRYINMGATSSSVMSGATRTYYDQDGVPVDLNFEYLRHVVLKFMLSRESEAQHLIKAVSVLLKFSTEEQRLIAETLDWKMSWFGARPKSGSGQKAKYIPPSY